jgi:hypothetical protein
MRRLALTGLVLVSTFAWLGVLMAARPFDLASSVMDRAFGALPAWTQVENMYRDENTQEVSRGDHPLESFRILRKFWSLHAGARRIVLLGNSQTQMTSLAAGEAPPSGPEKTYTDHIADRYRGTGESVFYRLSAGALSYPEMLWYVAYLTLDPRNKPDVLLVQLNYQNFANSGIRDGMLELLSEHSFRERIEELAKAGRADSAVFARALRKYDEAQRNTESKGSAGSLSPGYRIETAFRAVLSRIPGFPERGVSRQGFVLLLYRCRSYILRLQPATRRSLSGIHPAAGRAALEDLAELCGRSGIRMILFQAPTNPAVPLYGTPDDDRTYHGFADSLRSRYGLTTLDFEHSIPQPHWGMTLNVPDPLHLSREGHRRMAELMLEGLKSSGI